MVELNNEIPVKKKAAFDTYLYLITIYSKNCLL